MKQKIMAVTLALIMSLSVFFFTACDLSALINRPKNPDTNTETPEPDPDPDPDPVPDKSNPESIIIIDASVSMHQQSGGNTRFVKAVSEAKALGKEKIDKKEPVSVIIAGKTAYYVNTRTSSISALNEALNDLIKPNSVACTYGNADIDGALTLAQEILTKNPKAQVTLFTASQYTLPQNIVVKNVSSDKEWNAAILDVTAILEENYYIFEVEVVSYNKDKDITVYLEAYDVNFEQQKLIAKRIVSGINNESVVFYFDYLDIYSYNSVRVYIEEDDSFAADNIFYLFGGVKETVDVLYVSPLPNTFINGTLYMLRQTLRPYWDINITQAGLDEVELSGYDFYIFEHMMPQILPTDGVVLLIDPDTLPLNSGLGFANQIIDGQAYYRDIYGEYYEEAMRLLAEGGELPPYILEIIEKYFQTINNEDNTNANELIALSAAEPNSLSEILNNIDPSRIEVSKYTRIVSYEESYQPLMLCGADPVFLVKDEVDSKIAVLAFGLNYSNLPMISTWPILMYNLFNYFLPPAITKNVFEVNEQITLNARGQALNLTGPGIDETFDAFPCEISLPLPGVYTLTQELMSGKIITDYFYVKVPKPEGVSKRPVDESDLIQVSDKILIIDRDGESEKLKALIENGFEDNYTVDTVNIASVPKTMDALKQYGQIILMNIANADMPVGFDSLLYSYVYDFGGGLLTAGGSKTVDGQEIANAYNRDDMKGTLYQKMLPVDCIDYTPPIAVMIVIDRSGSMSQIDSQTGITRLELAKAGAIACIDSLSDRDYVGVISFSDNVKVEIPLTPVTQKSRILNAIANIPVEGGTLYSEAIQTAGQALQAMTGVAGKHIMFITDGMPADAPEAYESLIAQYYAQAGITLSTVGIGTDVNFEILKRMAELGNGRVYDASNPSTLPIMMRDEFRSPEIMGYIPEPFTPKIKEYTWVTNGIFESAIPQLDGYYGTKAKIGASVALVAPYGAPVYAQWNFGNGNVGSFMCDLDGVWSDQFMTDPTGIKIISNIIAGLFREQNMQGQSA